MSFELKLRVNVNVKVKSYELREFYKEERP